MYRVMEKPPKKEKVARPEKMPWGRNTLWCIQILLFLKFVNFKIYFIEWKAHKYMNPAQVRGVGVSYR